MKNWLFPINLPPLCNSLRLAQFGLEVEGECCVLFVSRSFVIKKKNTTAGEYLWLTNAWGLQMRSKSLKQHCPALCIKKTKKIGRTSNCGWFKVRQLFLVYRKVDAAVNATLQDPAWTGEPRKAKWPVPHHSKSGHSKSPTMTCSVGGFTLLPPLKK